MKEYIGCIIGIVIFLVVFIWSYFKDFTKSDKWFIRKKWLDIGMNLALYTFLVMGYNCYQKIGYTYPGIGQISLVMALFLCMAIIKSCVFQLYYFNGSHVITKRSNTISITIASIFITLIIALSAMYFILYIINPNWFVVNDEWSIYRLAFEFIYYTLSLTITYGSNTIVATGVIPKTLQMVHIFLFYISLSRVIIALTSLSTQKER